MFEYNRQSDNSSDFSSMEQSFATNNVTNLTSHLPSTPIAYLNICASCSSVTVTLTLDVL